MKKLQTFDSIYFRQKSHFGKDCTQNYLVFQPMYRYFKRVSGVGSHNCIYFWKSNILSDGNITAPTTSDYKLNSQLSYFGTKTRIEVKGSCLKQEKVTYDLGKIVNIYIVYEISRSFNISNYPTRENCVQLSGLKMLKFTRINILDVELDLIDMTFFHSLVVELVEM